MALSVPSFPSPYSATPLTDVVAYMAGLSLDVSTKQGRMTFNVHQSVADMEGGHPPIAQISIGLGEVLVPGDPNAVPPVEAVRCKTLDELLAEPGFLAGFHAIADSLYTEATKYPKFAAATVDPLVVG